MRIVGDLKKKLNWITSSFYETIHHKICLHIVNKLCTCMIPFFPSESVEKKNANKLNNKIYIDKKYPQLPSRKLAAGCLLRTWPRAPDDHTMGSPGQGALVSGTALTSSCHVSWSP